jgi:hypothetical protein
MTQDQYGQSRGPGYVERGDVVPEDETAEARTEESEESRPMTRFQKVASALLGSGSERDEQDQAAADRTAADQVPGDRVSGDRTAADRTAADRTAADRTAADAQGADAQAGGLPWVTPQDEAAMADSPISQEAAQKRDYWDDPNAAAGHEDDAVAVTSPDTLRDHEATEPDMFGTTRRTGEGPAAAPAAEGQPGAATIADVPAARTPVGEAPVGEAPADAAQADAAQAADGRASDVPVAASDVPAPAAEAAGTTGRHAAATPASPADGQLRPGEATAALGDFSDLTYGNLVPDAEQFAAQWQDVQFRFVDDPHGSVTEAADIVAQVTAKMEAAIQERQRAIEERQHAIAEQQRSLRGRWGEGSNADTENLRETLRMYKTFLDQLIGPRAS